MTGDELKERRRRIGWAAEVLAREAKVSDRHWRRMEAGERPVPEDISAWVQRLSDAIAAVPPPAGPPVLGKAGRPKREHPEGRNVPQ